MVTAERPDCEVDGSCPLSHCTSLCPRHRDGWLMCCPADRDAGGRKSYLDNDEMTLLA